MAEKKVPFGHHGFHGRCQQFPFPSRASAENVAMNNGFGDVSQVLQFMFKTNLQGGRKWLDTITRTPKELTRKIFCLWYWCIPGHRWVLVFDSAVWIARLRQSCKMSVIKMCQ